MVQFIPQVMKNTPDNNFAPYTHQFATNPIYQNMQAQQHQFPSPFPSTSTNLRFPGRGPAYSRFPRSYAQATRQFYCTFWGLRSHNSENCWHKLAQPQAQGIDCYNCGKYGHYARDCRGGNQRGGGPFRGRFNQGVRNRGFGRGNMNQSQQPQDNNAFQPNNQEQKN